MHGRFTVDEACRLCRKVGEIRRATRIAGEMPAATYIADDGRILEDVSSQLEMGQTAPVVQMLVQRAIALGEPSPEFSKRPERYRGKQTDKDVSRQDYHDSRYGEEARFSERHGKRGH